MLSEPQVPFPVSTNHEIRPDLVRLEGPLLTPDKLYPQYLEAKRAVIDEPWSSLWVRETRQDPTSDPRVLMETLDFLWQKAAEAYHLEPPVRGTNQHLADQVMHRGRQLAMNIQEDFVLMHGTRAEAMWVCLPSRWDPAEKIGRDFAQIHQPVPHSEALQKAQHNVAKAMYQKGPFARYVWGLTYDPQLCQHPAQPRIEEGSTVYFRAERQVTLPMPELQRSWFLIRIFNVPLWDVLHTPERKQLLLESLRSMSPEHIAYKHMQHIVPRVLAELEGR